MASQTLGFPIGGLNLQGVELLQSHDEEDAVVSMEVTPIMCCRIGLITVLVLTNITLLFQTRQPTLYK